MIKLNDDLPIIEQLMSYIATNSVSPSDIFSRGGNVNGPTYLFHDGFLSSVTGAPFDMVNGRLLKLWAVCNQVSTFTARLGYHYGDLSGYTALTTVSIVNSKSASFTELDFGLVNIPGGSQLVMEILTGTARNPKIKAFY